MPYCFHHLKKKGRRAPKHVLSKFSTGNKKALKIHPSSQLTDGVQYPRPEMPRLDFSGLFFSDPSTVNNNVMRYDIDAFRPNFIMVTDEANINGSWNPDGSGVFAFVDCVVDSVKTISPVSENHSGLSGTPNMPCEPLLGIVINNTLETVQAKHSDIDPQMQITSEIYGLKINIGDKGDFYLQAEMEPCVLRDFWIASQVSGRASYCAVHQSILKIIDFNAGSSPFFQECLPFINQSKCEKYPNGALSIFFRTDNFNAISDEECFRYGDCIGFIEPFLCNSPTFFDAERLMSPVGKENFNLTQFRLEKNESSGEMLVRMFLGNSIKRRDVDTFKDFGNLSLAILPNGWYDTAVPPVIEILEEIPYRNVDFLHEKNTIAEILIPASKVELCETSPLAIVQVDGDTRKVVLAESNDGIFCHADKITHRINPGDVCNVDFYVTRFGRRLADAEISVGFDSSTMYGTGEDGPEPPEVAPLPGIPASGLIVNGQTPDDDDGVNFTTVIRTNRHGHAVLSLRGGNAKNYRRWIDGQMYGLRYAFGLALPELGTSGSPSEYVFAKVFDMFTPPEKPTWLSDIYPIFKQYANLYPAMHTLVSLDDFGSVVERREALIRVFSVAETDPSYMPIPRDLSRAKRNMIVKWLSTLEKGFPVFMDITRESDLKNALQMMIELEHATIPPYLTALYSIKPGYNKYVADALKDVVKEEMLHFGLVGNIMNAIGFRPNISKIGLVPKYPGVLPGGLRKGLVMRLRKCSINQMKVFMDLEAPEQQKLPDQGEVEAESANLQQNLYTIGYVYDMVIKSIRYLEKNGTIQFPDKSDNPGNWNLQVTGPETWSQWIKIRTVDDAVASINIIKEQGEGASPTDPSDGLIDSETGLPKLSHFFRFSEIVKGRRIVSGEDGFTYTGPKITIDPEGVYNMQDDPNVMFLPVGSQARERLESFSMKYQVLLNGLHKTFNGCPDFLNQTLSAMYQLTIFAEPLMKISALNLDSTPKDDGTTVGISFQVPLQYYYIPTKSTE